MTPPNPLPADAQNPPVVSPPDFAHLMGSQVAWLMIVCWSFALFVAGGLSLLAWQGGLAFSPILLGLSAGFLIVCFRRFHHTMLDIFRGTLMNIRQRKILEETLVKKVEELNEAQRASEQASHAKSEFLANMSHEIRTPMTAILGNADLLFEEGDLAKAPERRVESLRTIQRNGEHLLGIINDILDLSKIEAGKLALETVRYSPTAVLEEILSLMNVRARGKGIQLNVCYETPIPEEIQTDPARLRQILVNLTANALKFTEVGGVKILVRLISEHNPRLEFDVVDTGIGMTAEQCERLFQPFSQADSSTMRQFGGTGLGLTISQRLAEMLGGNVRIIESLPDVGTRFRLSIQIGSLDETRLIDPQEAAQSLEERVRSPLSASSSGTSLSGFRLLLAEDGPDNQRLISHVLMKAKADVTVVENGRLAVQTALEAEQLGKPFDVILMDMQMPIMDGYGASCLLRAKDYQGPIIALTAHAMTGDKEKCLAAGCDDYATKPIDREALINLIAQWCASEFPRENSAPDPTESY